MANTRSSNRSKREIVTAPGISKNGNRKIKKNKIGKTSIKEGKKIDLNTVEQKILRKNSLKRLEDMYKQALESDTIEKKNSKDIEMVTNKQEPDHESLKFNHVIYKVNDVEMITMPEFPEIKMKITKTGKHPYMCKRCLMGFSTRKAYEAHAPVHIAKSAKKPLKKFRCNVCQKEFAKSMYLERHNRIHTGEKPFKCTICDKNFVQPSNLSTHMLKHLKIKPFICEICNLRFERKDILKRHILTHSAEKPIKCTICNKGFIRQAQLQQHLRMKHSKEMSEPYVEIKVVEEYERKCDTEKTENLSDHLIMAPLHIKPFVCELCNEHFERKHLFRQHILLHSMRKPVNCSVCNKRYMRESSLRYHMNLKHRQKTFIPLIELKDEETIEDFFNENLPFA